MGDSGISIYFSVAALVLVAGAVTAFVVAWRVKNRTLRIVVGILLLATAILSSFLSTLAMLVIAVLGVCALVLATRSAEGKKPTPETDPK